MMKPINGLGEQALRSFDGGPYSRQSQLLEDSLYLFRGIKMLLRIATSV